MKLFELTDEDVQAIKGASKPVPYMVFGGMEPESPYDRAMREWKRIGEKYGFKWDSVTPGPSERFVYADPSEAL